MNKIPMNHIYILAINLQWIHVTGLGNGNHVTGIFPKKYITNICISFHFPVPNSDLMAQKKILFDGNDWPLTE